MASTSAAVRFGSVASAGASREISGVREMGGTLNTRNLRPQRKKRGVSNLASAAWLYRELLAVLVGGANHVRSSACMQPGGTPGHLIKCVTSASQVRHCPRTLSQKFTMYFWGQPILTVTKGSSEYQDVMHVLLTLHNHQWFPSALTIAFLTM